MHYSAISASGPINDLVAFDIRNNLYPPSWAKWREKAPVVMPQSCARQLWFFEQSQLATFPAEEAPKYGIKLMRGKEVYNHLLKVIVGADSENVGETNIAGQFNVGWAKFQREHPDSAPFYDRIVQNLWADSSLIRTHFSSKIQSKRFEMVARGMVDPKGRETVLVVGDVNPDGTLAHTTDHICRAFGNNSTKAAKEIIITNPDPEKAAQLYAALVVNKEKGLVKCDISTMPFEDLAIGFEVADFTFVATPMRQDRDADAAMISTWQNRLNAKNTLVHLRGDPFNQGGSVEEWDRAELKNYISVEDVRDKAIDVGRRNSYLAALTKKAVDYCTECRVEGERPDKKLMAQLSELTHQDRDDLFIDAAFSGTMKLGPK